MATPSLTDLGLEDDDEFAHLLVGGPVAESQPSFAAKRVAIMSSKAGVPVMSAIAATSRLGEGGDGMEAELRAELAPQQSKASTTTSGHSSSGSTTTSATTTLSAEERAAIQARLAQADSEPAVHDLDEAQVKRLCVQLNKAHESNQVGRAKHSGEPEKFIESEESLHDCVRGLQAVASAPQLLATMVRAGGAETVLAVVSHPNADVSVAALELLDECMEAEADTAEDAVAMDGTRGDKRASAGSVPARPLATAIVRLGGCEAVVTRLWQLDESGDEDDEEGSMRALSVLDSLLQADLGSQGLEPHGRLVACGLLELLLRRIQPSAHRPLTSKSTVSSSSWLHASSSSSSSSSASKHRVTEDVVRFECASLLALLLQSSSIARASLIKLRAPAQSPAASAAVGLGWAQRQKHQEEDDQLSGMELLVRAISFYRFDPNDPTTVGERECCESVFEATQAAVMPAAISGSDDGVADAASSSEAGRSDSSSGVRVAMQEVEAVELLSLVAQRAGRFPQHCALKALAVVCDGWDWGCRVAVRSGVLGAVLPVFMGRSRGIVRKLAGRDAAEEEAGAALVLVSELVRVSHSIVSDAVDKEDRVMRLRVVAKFLEQGGEKCVRLVDLRQDAAKRVRDAEGQARRETALLLGDEEVRDTDREELEAVVDVARMEAGLQELLRCDVMIARLSQTDHRIKARLLHRMATVRLLPEQLLPSMREAVAVLDLKQEQADGLTAELGAIIAATSA